MGLSPGFADPYHWTLPDQRLLVNGLDRRRVPAVGRRRPEAGGSARRTSENNRTWVDLRLTLTRSAADASEVVGRGPAGASAWVTG